MSRLEPARTENSSPSTSLDRRSFVATAAAAGGVACGAAFVPRAACETLSQITLDDFRACLNERFHLTSESGVDTEMELLEATASRHRSEAVQGRQPFSLIFQVRDDLKLKQQTYRVYHRRFGTLPIFLVPVDSSARKIHLQAVFA